MSLKFPCGEMQGGQEAGERRLLGELQGRGDRGRAQEDPRESHAPKNNAKFFLLPRRRRSFTEWPV